MYDLIYVGAGLRFNNEMFAILQQKSANVIIYSDAIGIALWWQIPSICQQEQQRQQ